MHPKAVRRRKRSQAPAEAKPHAHRRGARRRAQRAQAAGRHLPPAPSPEPAREARRARHGHPAGRPRARRRARSRQGTVISSAGDKTITVKVEHVGRHRRYEKVIRRSRTLHAHDESNQANEGDVVRIVETRPISKTKRWRLVEILERAR